MLTQINKTLRYDIFRVELDADLEGIIRKIAAIPNVGNKKLISMEGKGTNIMDIEFPSPIPTYKLRSVSAPKDILDLLNSPAYNRFFDKLKNGKLTPTMLKSMTDMSEESYTLAKFLKAKGYKIDPNVLKIHRWFYIKQLLKYGYKRSNWEEHMKDGLYGNNIYPFLSSSQVRGLFGPWTKDPAIEKIIQQMDMAREIDPAAYKKFAHDLIKQIDNLDPKLNESKKYKKINRCGCRNRYE